MEAIQAKVIIELGESAREFLSDLAALIQQAEKISKAQAVAPSIGKAHAALSTPATNGKAGKAKVASKPVAVEVEEPAAEESESFDLGEDSTEDAPTPAITKKDLIAAARDNREVAIKVLKKLKVKSIHDLKPEQYSKVYAEIGA